MSYNEKDVVVQTAMEGIRKSPGMYINDTGGNGKNHMVREVVHNVFDEITMKRATFVKVTLHDDNRTVTIEDDGPGIPTGIHESTGISTVETVSTVVHAGGKFESSAYKKSGGLHGVGLTVVNALSSSLKICVKRDGHIWEIEFSKGEKLYPLRKVGKTTEHGTSITFTPDYTIMEDMEYDPLELKNELDDLSYLNKMATVIFCHNGVCETMSHDNSVAGLTEKYTTGSKVMNTPIYISGKDEERDIDVEIAFNYTKVMEEKFVAFTNNINNPEGGTHITGFRSALTRAVNQITGKDYKGEELRLGLILGVSIKMSERPELEGQTKSKLGSKQVQPCVDSIVYSYLMENWNKNSKVVKYIVQRAESQRKHKDELANNKDLEKDKKARFNGIRGNHTAATNKGRANKHLFITEGISAGGTAIAARVPETQGVLPMRGKIKNTYGMLAANVLAVTEIRSIVTAIGTGIGTETKVEDTKYERIIILADADADGAHIQCLLITFFYEWMYPLLQAGMIYVSIPPLYKVYDERYEDGEFFYCNTEEEKVEAQAKFGKYAAVSRYKGIGEMNKEELEDTVMNPDSRTLIQITIEDANDCKSMLQDLMGSDTKARKNILTEEGIWDGNNNSGITA